VAWDEAYLRTKWHLDQSSRFATTDMGRIWAVPLGRRWVPIQHNVAGAEAYLLAKFHLDPSNRLATIHQRYRQTDKQDRQDSRPIAQLGQTVLQTVAPKRCPGSPIFATTFYRHRGNFLTIRAPLRDSGDKIASALSRLISAINVTRRRH